MLPVDYHADLAWEESLGATRRAPSASDIAAQIRRTIGEMLYLDGEYLRISLASGTASCASGPGIAQCGRRQCAAVA
eukprot:3444629-Rhodomonas_salina.2